MAGAGAPCTGSEQAGPGHKSGIALPESQRGEKAGKFAGKGQVRNAQEYLLSLPFQKPDPLLY